MRTIGHHRNTKQSGDCQSLCDYCGVVYYRSALERTEDLMLACRDCARGRVLAELDRENLEAYLEPTVVEPEPGNVVGFHPLNFIGRCLDPEEIGK